MGTLLFLGIFSHRFYFQGIFNDASTSATAAAPCLRGMLDHRYVSVSLLVCLSACLPVFLTACPPSPPTLLSLSVVVVVVVAGKHKVNENSRTEKVTARTL